MALKGPNVYLTSPKKYFGCYLWTQAKANHCNSIIGKLLRTLRKRKSSLVLVQKLLELCKWREKIWWYQRIQLNALPRNVLHAQVRSHFQQEPGTPPPLSHTLHYVTTFRAYQETTTRKCFHSSPFFQKRAMVRTAFGLQAKGLHRSQNFVALGDCSWQGFSSKGMHVTLLSGWCL